MSGFINHLLNAHFSTGHIVQPRLKGTFELYSPSQQVPATQGQQSFDPIQHGTGEVPLKQQAVHTPATAGSFAGNDGNHAIAADQYTEDDSHLLISPPKASKRNIIENASPASVQNFDPVVGQQKITAEHPFEDEFFTNQSATVADAGFVSKKNAAFTPMHSGQPGQGLDQQASNNLVWVKAFKNMVSDQPQGNASITEPQSVIKVNIGRIDVRAVTQQAPPRETTTPRPGVSLSDFLKNKNGSK
ncbi:MAG: hypothetical protein JWR05_172 [Mucilaginibacter sp.]|nr:hypothetical protein [Mucilaginibacter sp.]